MRVLWTRPALRHVSDVLQYLHQRSPAAAGRVAETTRTTANGLVQFPLRGRIGRVEGSRELVVPKLLYIVAYQVEDDVRILAVMHTSQEWPERFEDRS